MLKIWGAIGKRNTLFQVWRCDQMEGGQGSDSDAKQIMLSDSCHSVCTPKNG